MVQLTGVETELRVWKGAKSINTLIQKVLIQLHTRQCPPKSFLEKSLWKFPGKFYLPYCCLKAM